MRAGDILIAILLFCLSVAFYAHHLGALEFFRHTEADRTLIAWEMLQSGNFLVPHLLHSPILTKPPLFYWALAASIWFFGAANEWIVRFPSVLCGGLFAALQYLFLRTIRFERHWALAGALMLMTGASFQEFGTLAEIDMMFGFLSGLVFMLGYLSIERRSLPLTISTFLLLALAFLVKGPPSLGFYAAGFLVFIIWSWMSKERSGLTHEELRRIVWNHLLGFIIGAVPVILWASLLASRVGWDALGYQVHVELVERIFGKAQHARGSFFYLFAFATAMLPWTFVIAAAMLRRVAQTGPAHRISPEHRRFLIWNLSLVVPAIILLSFASGKSNRYLFPLYGPSISLALLSLIYLRGTLSEKRLFLFARGLAVVGALFGLLFPIFFRLEGVPLRVLWIEGVLCAVFCLALYRFLKLQMAREAFLTVCLLMCIVQFGRTDIWAPNRNATRSVKAIANEIHTLVPPGQMIYNIELFDRWVNYYLKLMGRDSARVSPEVAAHFIAKPARCYLLLDYEEENWRFEKLKTFDPTVRLIKEFSDPKEHLLLIEAAGEKLYNLEPHDYFPTVPSPPY